MELNEPLIVDNDLIRESILYPKCGTDLKSLSYKDYPNQNFFTEEILCLDMDKYEKLNANGNNNMTMDAAIGIRSFVGHDATFPRKLLIELRMGYKNVNNLDKKILIGKVQHTRSILQTEGTVDKNYIFVLTDAIYQKARRWFRDHSAEDSILKQYLPWSVSMVNNNILPISKIPYTPKTDINSMISGLKQKLNNKDKSNFFKMLEHFLKLAKKYQYSEPFEYNVLKPKFAPIWKEYLQKQDHNNDEEILEAEILLEDYNEILNAK